jgi:endoglucanase
MSKVSLRVPREGVVPSSRGAEAKFGTDFLLRLWNDQTMTFTITSGSARGNAKTVGDHDIWRLPQADDTFGGSDPLYRYIRPASRVGWGRQCPSSRVSSIRTGTL